MERNSDLNKQTQAYAANTLMFFDAENVRENNCKYLDEVISADQQGVWLPYTAGFDLWNCYSISYNTIEEMIVDMMRYRRQPLTLVADTMRSGAAIDGEHIICSLTVEGMEIDKVINYLINCMRNGSEIVSAAFIDSEPNWNMAGCSTYYELIAEETETAEPVTTLIKIIVNE